MLAYNAAMEGEVSQPPSRYGSRTLGGLWTDFCRSTEYTNLSKSSKITYRRVIGPVLSAHGHRPISGMKRDHARKILEAIGVTAPAQANLTQKVLHRLMVFAVANGWRNDNPFQKLPQYKLGKHHSWTDEELIAFESRWALGTRERLAFDLLLYTAQRGGDVVALRHSDTVSGQFSIIQQKTGTPLVIPVHPNLQLSINAVPKKGIYLLGDKWGRPIQRQSITRIIRQAAKIAGLPPKCVAHGLRKAALRRLAERGASDKEIAAVSGHKSMDEVQRYTEAADQTGLARQAIKRLLAKS
jgi:integrase